MMETQQVHQMDRLSCVCMPPSKKNKKKQNLAHALNKEKSDGILKLSFSPTTAHHSDSTVSDPAWGKVSKSDSVLQSHFYKII